MGIIAALILIAVIISALWPHMYKIVFLGDRISMNTSVRVNGEAYQINESDVSCTSETGNEKVNYKYISDAVQCISVKGDDYGMYVFTFAIADSKLELTLIHTNWWEPHSGDFEIDIDAEKNTCSYSIYGESGTIKSDDGGRTYKIHEMI